MRVFAALPLPAAVSNLLDSALAPARRARPELRWVAAAGLHVTLRFFGDVSEEGVAVLRQAFDDPDLRVSAIATRLGKVGQFPPRGNPRVLWVGFERGEAEIRAYWSLFEEKIVPLGWPPDERVFSAHMTIARAGRARSAALNQSPQIPAVDFLTEECVLFQSILEPGGARYVPLKRITLGRGHG